MSIDFVILCTQPPDRFLARRARRLRWSGRTGSGSFAGMTLSLAQLRATDPLPAPDWADRVVAVLRASGHLGDDSFDDFDDWTTKLADATQGAVYSHASGEFIHVWNEVDAAPTPTRTHEWSEVDEAAARQLAEVRASPPPTDVAELAELLAASERGDPLGWPRLESFLGWRHPDPEQRQALVVELARSGREVAPVQIEALAALVTRLEELTAASGRDAFARHGALASAIAELAAARQTEAEQHRRSRQQDIERRVAEHDALYGRDRKRPRMPEDLLDLIRRGEIEAAVLAYRARFPKLAAQAARAVEDARVLFGPRAPRTS